jgi:hypothetical protein
MTKRLEKGTFARPKIEPGSVKVTRVLRKLRRILDHHLADSTLRPKSPLL